MTRDDILRIAKEADVWVAGQRPYQTQLERFADLILEQKANVHDKVYSEVDLANAYQKGWDDAMLRRRIGARGQA
jgi:hypothetical protein